jgi:hypothetical protein
MLDVLGEQVCFASQPEITLKPGVHQYLKIVISVTLTDAVLPCKVDDTSPVLYIEFAHNIAPVGVYGKLADE